MAPDGLRHGHRVPMQHAGNAGCRDAAGHSGLLYRGGLPQVEAAAAHGGLRGDSRRSGRAVFLAGLRVTFAEALGNRIIYSLVNRRNRKEKG